MRGRMLIAIALLMAAANGVYAQDEALTSIGALGGGFMYTSYLAIGAIADGNYHEVYDDPTTVSLMTELAKLTSSAADALQALVNSGTLSPQDFSYVNEIVTTLGLLSRQAEGFKAYVETGDEKQAALYGNFRTSAWAKIAELLKIGQ